MMREVWPAFAVLIACMVALGGIAWIVARALGADSEAQLVIATQAPIIGLVLLWGASIYYNGRAT